MSIKISKKKRFEHSKVIAVWSPSNAGKTFTAVNLASYFSLHEKHVSLVDLTFDKAVHTWLNCSANDSLERLIKQGVTAPYNPRNVPNLQVYTSMPGSHIKFDGQTEELNKVLKAMEGGYTFIDLPSNYLVAGNTLAVADLVVFVCDYNIHTSILLKEYYGLYDNSVLVANKASDEYPNICDPENSLSVIPDIYIPDDPGTVYKNIITGNPVSLDSFRPDFEKLTNIVLNKIDNKKREAAEIAK